MMQFMHSRGYERGAIVIARLFLAMQFVVAAAFKIVGFSGEAAMTAAVGVPFANIAVGAALVLEVIGVIALLTGWKIRPVALLLAVYVLVLAVLFYHDWHNQITLGLFISHFELAAALLYVSVFGAKK